MQVQIKFTVGGSSSVFGNFAPGDTLRCDAAAAKHFVEDAKCAEYSAGKPPQAADFADTQPAADPAATTAPPAKPSRKASAAAK